MPKLTSAPWVIVIVPLTAIELLNVTPEEVVLLKVMSSAAVTPLPVTWPAIKLLKVYSAIGL